MPRDTVPQDIVELAEARANARRARDWATADDLLVQIEAAGWKVIDTGTLYDLERSAPPDVVADGVVRFGSSASVPSRLDEATTGIATVILVATDWPSDLARAQRSLLRHAPSGTQVVIVANAPSDEQTAALEAIDDRDAAAAGLTTEIVRTAVRLGHAAALNAGIRRAAARVVMVLDTSVEPEGDLVSALAAALEDDTVAIAGAFGVVSDDLRSFADAAPGTVDVDAIEGYAMAFRRTDYVARGPLDEHFVFYRNLDIWWSLVLRDQGEHDPDDAPPRRAVRVTSVQVVRHEQREWGGMPAGQRDRLSKKNYYRVLKRFASRRDLLVRNLQQELRPRP